MSQKDLPKRILSIAGAESGGTAGIQADLKTFQEIGVYGMTAITAMVGQHPETKRTVHSLDLEVIEAQFAGALTRTGVDAVKTGMLFSKEVIACVANLLAQQNFKHVIVDPVMVGKLGKLDSMLLKHDAVETMKAQLFPLAELIMPNMIEASFLLEERPISNLREMEEAAKDLYAMGPKNILIKGGRLENQPAIDVLYNGDSFCYFEAARIETNNTSGAGDTISAAAAAYLAKGLSMKESIKKAKIFVTTAIANSFSYRKKIGPVNQHANRDKSKISDIKVYE